MRLKQSTSIQVPFGPFVSNADGLTLAAGLAAAMAAASTGVRLCKNGGSQVDLHSATVAYDAFGIYRVTLDATDTNTLGSLRITYAAAATNFAMYRDFEIVNANEWDSSFGTSVFKKTDLTQILTSGADISTLQSVIESNSVGTVSQLNTSGDTTHFRCSDIIVAAASSFVGCEVKVATGAQQGYWLGVVTAYSVISGEGAFTVSPGSPILTALLNGVKVVIR